jgi:hypothetical protein
MRSIGVKKIERGKGNKIKIKHRENRTNEE